MYLNHMYIYCHIIYYLSITTQYLLSVHKIQSKTYHTASSKLYKMPKSGTGTKISTKN